MEKEIHGKDFAYKNFSTYLLMQSNAGHVGVPYSFSGQHWLNQDFLVPFPEAKLWFFTKSGMIHPVAVKELPADTGNPDEAQIEKVKSLRTVFICLSLFMLAFTWCLPMLAVDSACFLTESYWICKHAMCSSLKTSVLSVTLRGDCTSFLYLVSTHVSLTCAYLTWLTWLTWFTVCVVLVQVVSLDDGDEVIQVMLNPDQPAENECLVLLTAAGFMSRQPIAGLMEKSGDTDDMTPFRCMAVQVNQLHGQPSQVCMTSCMHCM